jgi:hypothetical protein
MVKFCIFGGEMGELRLLMLELGETSDEELRRKG